MSKQSLCAAIVVILVLALSTLACGQSTTEKLADAAATPTNTVAAVGPAATATTEPTPTAATEPETATKPASTPTKEAEPTPTEAPPTPTTVPVLNMVLIPHLLWGKTFVRGEGTQVWDAEGNAYLDFVAGYGSLNLGHNHPAVVEAVQAALREAAPGFSPAAVNPYAAALAEQLATISPPGLEITFFANSGTEAVEAALKLARKATGRAGLLYCERSYHGKSLGSLSVTGNPVYQKPFEPLVPDCVAVPLNGVRAEWYIGCPSHL